MKYRLWHIGAVLGILVAILSSCSNSGKGDLENILRPGSMPFLKDSKLIHISSHAARGEKNDMITVPAGKAVNVLQVGGPGVDNPPMLQSGFRRSLVPEKDPDQDVLGR